MPPYSWTTLHQGSLSQIDALSHNQAALWFNCTACVGTLNITLLGAWTFLEQHGLISLMSLATPPIYKSAVSSVTTKPSRAIASLLISTLPHLYPRVCVCFSHVPPRFLVSLVKGLSIGFGLLRQCAEAFASHTYKARRADSHLLGPPSRTIHIAMQEGEGGGFGLAIQRGIASPWQEEAASSNIWAEKCDSDYGLTSGGFVVEQS